MNLTLVTMALVILSTAAHLEINLVAGDFAQLSEKAASLPGNDEKTIECRTSIAEGNQRGRDPNDPTPGDVCHGIDMLGGDRLATLTAGGQFTWGILEDKLGSGHDGGHCAWFVSDGVDQTKWYKFADVLDCTNEAKGGDQPDQVKIPKNLPISCKEACTIMWLWSPLHTANCEIYSNCFDVKIEGAEGGIEDDYPMLEAPFNCMRASTITHKTSSFGRFINVDPSDGSIVLEKVDDGDQSCYQYTVRADDSLESIRAKFDFSVEELYSKNNAVMPRADVIPAPGEKLVIAGCGTDVQVVVSAGSKYMSVLTVLGAFVVSLF